jgi:hypothetical protein
MVLFKLEMIQANNRLFHTEKNSFIRSATIKLSYILLGVVPCVAWDFFFLSFFDFGFLSQSADKLTIHSIPCSWIL